MLRSAPFVDWSGAVALYNGHESRSLRIQTSGYQPHSVHWRGCVVVPNSGGDTLRCNYAFLCDFAQEAGGGKVNALGIGLVNIQAATLPAKHPQMTFAASLSGTIAEAGMKRVELRFIDADGNNILINPVRWKSHGLRQRPRE